MMYGSKMKRAPLTGGRLPFYHYFDILFVRDLLLMKARFNYDGNKSRSRIFSNFNDPYFVSGMFSAVELNTTMNVS